MFHDERPEPRIPASWGVREVKDDGRRLRVRVTFDIMARLGDKSESEVVDSLARSWGGMLDSFENFAVTAVREPGAVPEGVCPKRGDGSAHVIPAGKSRCVLCYPEDER